MSVVDYEYEQAVRAGQPVIIVETLTDFIETAEQHRRSLIVLRSATPPSSDELRRYCIALGGLLQFEQDGDVRMVKYDPAIPNSTAMSTDALPFHTDGSFLAQPPGRFMLSFSAKDQGGGGVSIFMPISRVLAAAPEWVLEALFSADYLFVKTYDGDLSVSHVGPALYREDSALRIRWRSDDIWRPKVVDARGTDAQGAVDWLHEFLYTAEPLSFAAETGDTVLVPNTLMLHGRTSMSPNSVREVLRAWVT
ncbi:MAG TPA: TauD/TfdA family dioxygenase [Pyrinomonadaceae bacterium]